MSKHQIQINLSGLLQMLGENIYSDPEVAVRKMIQNAHDGSIIRTTKDPGFKHPRIDLAFDKAARTLTITDNGTGMTESEGSHGRGRLEPGVGFVPVGPWE